MAYKDNTSDYLGNDKMTIGSGAPKTPEPAKTKKAKSRKGFMSGTKAEKKGDMESVAGGLKGAQMLIKTLFPKDEPISVR